jgi:hypothetical protein
MPATIQTAAETVWWASWCPLIVICRMTASLGSGSPLTGVLRGNVERWKGCPIWCDSDLFHLSGAPIKTFLGN